MNTLENCQQPPAPNLDNSFRCHDSKMESFIYSAGRRTRARVFSHSKANICVAIKIECRCRRRRLRRCRRCCRRRCCCYYFGLIVKSAAHVALVLFSSLFSLPTSSKQHTHTHRAESLLFSFFDDDADESAPKIRDRLKKKKEEEEKENNELCSTYAACFHLRHSLS